MLKGAGESAYRAADRSVSNKFFRHLNLEDVWRKCFEERMKENDLRKNCKISRYLCLIFHYRRLKNTLHYL
ncbi:hypothetical protein TNCV_2793661 [Trichonephila clavipes]|nr:hypothetical protein TNCV_2793661 [Trichonephila clavipes]